MNSRQLFCRTAERRLSSEAVVAAHKHGAGAFKSGAAAAACTDVELVSLRGCEEQHQQLMKPHHHQHHRLSTDCCSYSHVWPVMMETAAGDNQDDDDEIQPESSSTQRRYFELLSDRRCHHVEHIYRSVGFPSRAKTAKTVGGLSEANE